MQRARWEARERRRDTEVPGDDPRARRRQRQGRRRQVVGDREPRGRARGAGPHRRRARRRHLGLQRPAHARRRRAGSAGPTGKIDPNVVEVPNLDDPDGAPGAIKVVSMGFLVDDEGTALMWRGLILTKALEQFLTDVRWGELDYLLDRHAARAPATSRWRWPACCRSAEMLVVTTPAAAAQRVAVRVADMARRSYLKVDRRRREHERVRRARRRAPRDLRRGRRRRSRPRLGAPLVGRDPDRARGVRGRRHRRRRSCSRTPTARRRVEFHAHRRRASSTSCCRRSSWPAAPPGSSSWRRRTSPPRTPPGTRTVAVSRRSVSPATSVLPVAAHRALRCRASPRSSNRCLRTAGTAAASPAAHTRASGPNVAAPDRRDHRVAGRGPVGEHVPVGGRISREREAGGDVGDLDVHLHRHALGQRGEDLGDRGDGGLVTGDDVLGRRPGRRRSPGPGPTPPPRHLVLLHAPRSTPGRRRGARSSTASLRVAEIPTA